VKNVRTWSAWFQVAALATMAASGCVENDDKKAPPPPAESAPAVPPEPKRSAAPIDPAVAYTVTNAAGTKCLQFGGGSKDDVAQAEVAPCNGSKAQQFNLQTVPGNYYALINANSGKCLDVSAYGMSDGALVQQYQCNGGANQHWIVAEGTGGVRLIARHSGKALTIQDTSGPAGVGKVTQETAGTGPAQQLKLKGPSVVADGEAAAGGHKGKDGAGGAPGRKSRKSAAAPAAKKP
jgi:endo-1,4-beta-xylanase